MKNFAIILLSGSALLFASSAEEITFPAADGLEISGDLYPAENAHAVITLFHQAGSSRDEYTTIAPRLTTLGFHCIAIDQRSGNNETNTRAQAQGKPTGYLDAAQDLEATIAQAKTRYPGLPVIAWGSSYSASLVLKLAGEQPDLVTATLSFSPGEYFTPKDLIATAAAGIKIPTFITSARNEVSQRQSIFDAIPASTGKIEFTPQSAGRHGSTAIKPSTPGHEEYQAAADSFLSQFLPQDTTLSLTLTDGKDIELNLSGTTGTLSTLSVSPDLKTWTTLATIPLAQESTALRDGAMAKTEKLFYRAAPATTNPAAAITGVTASGNPGAYNFSVEITSTETGCDQYADWWEVLRADGTLAYRRVLGHSHVEEQPFTRSGGTVPITAEEKVYIRTHMNNTGYSPSAYQGTPATGFTPTTLPPTFAPAAATTAPLPTGCAF